jgi:prepilin signal peptidase PulO-like enzyme (type II secretory pathway)
VILLVTALAGILHRVTKDILILGALALTAGYCLVALAIISQWGIWIPGYLPLGAVWLIVLLNLFSPRKRLSSGVPSPIA